MKVKLKSDLPQPTDYLIFNSYYRYLCYLTVGKFYEVEAHITLTSEELRSEFVPLLYDTNTFEAEAVRFYIIYCDDGYARKFPMNYFITLEDYRDLQLEKLL